MKNRYPGAGPFQDDDLSRSIFFGREQETSQLASRIQAYRLTVVYGRSGLGKSSLLNAGVAPLLREAGFLPVSVRVNSMDTDLITTVAQYVEKEAGKREIEHVAGETSSPWEYFKSLELWQGDQLLIPVIIFDQFEEVFSIEDDLKREQILEDIGLMVRGVPSTTDETELRRLDEIYGSTAPKLQIVMAIREDYLGFLEEAADDVPQIFDSRFRVMPFSRESAEDALKKPSRVESVDLTTNPFELDDELVLETLDHLTGYGSQKSLRRKRTIEPFQLQLICKKIEETSIEKSSKTLAGVVVTFDDIGREKGLTRALRDFYSSALAMIKGWRMRRRVADVCLNHMISIDGKRQSIEEDNIRHRLGISDAALESLVDSRLFRMEVRADTKYYELSHDSLVQPVLASQGLSTRSVKMGYLSFLVGLFLLLLFVIAALFFAAYDAHVDTEKDSDDVLGMLLVGGFLLFLIKPLYTRMILRYKTQSRLKILQERTEAASHTQSIHRFQIPVGLLTLASAISIVMAGSTFLWLIVDEIITDERFTLAPYVVVFGFLSATLSGIALLRRGIRTLAGIPNYTSVISDMNLGVVQERWKIISIFCSTVFAGFLFILLASFGDAVCLSSKYAIISLKLDELGIVGYNYWCTVFDSDNIWLILMVFLFCGYGLLQAYRYITRQTLKHLVKIKKQGLNR